MKKEFRCYRCSETFTPNRIWEINGREICWHTCPDGKMAQNVIKERGGPRPVLAKKKRSLDD
jgi:hypothetical protein